MTDQDFKSLIEHGVAELSGKWTGPQGNAQLKDLSAETLTRIVLANINAAREIGEDTADFANVAGHYMDLVRQVEEGNGI